MKKNEIIELTITDIGKGGEGIGKSDGFPFFVKNALPGDRVSAVITKLNKNYGFAKVVSVDQKSPWRTDPPCPEAERCGGCQIMQLSYKKQLEFKENMVRNNLERIGGLKEPLMRTIIGMEPSDGELFSAGRNDVAQFERKSNCQPVHFRNKVQVPVGVSKEGRVVTGFYAGRTHYIIENKDCPVSAPETGVLTERIRQFIEDNGLSVYDETSGEGLVRHILLRTGTSTGQIMVCLIINGENLKAGKKQYKSRITTELNNNSTEYFNKENNSAKHHEKENNSLENKFVAWLRQTPDIGERITSICLNVNKEKTNVILGNKVIPLFGKPYIEDRIEDLTFRVSALSFFQVNGVQTEKLYKKALDYAQLTGREMVWDLYCGTGTISLFLARNAAKVYGVEIVPNAIEDAKENAKLNGIENAEFFCGKSEEIFSESKNADVVVLDPPRKGCDRKLLEAILKAEPKRIVYVSCDSATLARDIKILGSKYEFVEATPVDMFPHTCHVETCCLLERLRNAKDHVTFTLDMEDYYRIKDAEADKEKR